MVQRMSKTLDAITWELSERLDASFSHLADTFHTLDSGLDALGKISAVAVAATKV